MFCCTCTNQNTRKLKETSHPSQPAPQKLLHSAHHSLQAQLWTHGRELEQPTCTAAPPTPNRREQSPTACSRTVITHIYTHTYIYLYIYTYTQTMVRVLEQLTRMRSFIYTDHDFRQKTYSVKISTCMYESWKLLWIKISQKCTCLLKMTKYQHKEKPLFLFYYFKMDKNEKLSLL